MRETHHCNIGILGAGFSGLCTAIQLQLQLGTEDYIIFDENSDVGGVWLSNTYPGCASDVPTHLYSYSFSPKPDWSKLFCSQPEILEYLQEVAKKYDLYSNILFSHRVKKAAWDETISKWRLIVVNTSNEGVKNVEYILDDIIFCVGVFRVPHIPKEFETFEGPKMHSAKWDDGMELHDKNVAIVGTGASAVQIIPEIVGIVKTLTVYQRRPPWVLPRNQFAFPTWLNWVFAHVPGIRVAFRSSIFWLYEISHNIYTKGSKLSRLLEWMGKYHIRHRFQKKHDNEATRRKLIPNYHIGCKRITPSDDYYPALSELNVKIITAPITKVNKGSILTADGNEEHFDVLILATGYEAQEYFNPMEILTKDSADLLKVWKDNGPSSYLGLCSSILPNAFFVIGPNSAAGSTSAIFSVECHVNWIIQVLKEKQRRNCSIVTVKENAEQRYMTKVLSEMEKMVWSENCGSYYKDARGVVTGVTAKSGFNLWRQLKSPNFGDFTFN